MRYFVYYHDDYDGNGGKGLEEFDTRAGAIAFIEGRLAEDGYFEKFLENYTLIEGRSRALREVERVTRIEVADAEGR